MQEIATGVFIGNFNSQIREELWKIITQTSHIGEATLSYEYPNEVGYIFKTFNTRRKLVDFDGLPLVYFPFYEEKITHNKKFSKAYRYHMSRKTFTKNKKSQDFVFIDIETTGLDYENDQIIEVAALRIKKNKIFSYSNLIKINKKIPSHIVRLTSITDDLLLKKGKIIKDVLIELRKFIGSSVIIGYNIQFDISFINKACSDNNIEKFNNRLIDLLTLIRQQYKNLLDYKLEMVLRHFGIKPKLCHRALEDVESIYNLYLRLKEKGDFKIL